MDRILSQKNILITGGTSALGSAFVREALQAGATVYFTYHQNEARAKELTELGAKGFPLNLADQEAIDHFQREFRSQLKILHVLIHNAALTHDATIQNMSEKDWDETISVNLKAPYLLIKKLLALLFRAKPSKIFFIVSHAALQGIFGASNYAASKAGLVGLAKSLAQELGRKEVLVNCVNPGFMKSRMTEGLPESVIEKNLRESTLGKLSDPGEVAKFLVYLSSDQMTQVSGQVFHFESRKT
ncbi:MAG: SDR family oxidoreductase [Candidatus Omnitrophica bacterium]|nr:SDR family oxidoreductase [Candidatus Omnitrophota bacterium]